MEQTICLSDRDSIKDSIITKNVHIVKNNDVFYEDIMKQVYSLRYKIFCEEKQWIKPNKRKLDIDEFDNKNTTNFIYIDENQKVLGSYRLIPTNKPYMIKSIFSHLLGDATPPEEKKVYEISRLAVNIKDSPKSGYNNLSLVTSSLILALFQYAKKNNIKSIIGVTDIVVERLIRKAGLLTNRYSKPKNMGNCYAVALHSDTSDIDSNISKLQQCYSKAIAALRQ